MLSALWMILEPYRAFVDELVWRQHQIMPYQRDLSSADRKHLLGVLHQTCVWRGQTITLMEAIDKTAASFVRCLRDKRRRIVFGRMTNPSSTPV